MYNRLSGESQLYLNIFRYTQGSPVTARPEFFDQLTGLEIHQRRIPLVVLAMRALTIRA